MAFVSNRFYCSYWWVCRSGEVIETWLSEGSVDEWGCQICGRIRSHKWTLSRSVGSTGKNFWETRQNHNTTLARIIRHTWSFHGCKEESNFRYSYECHIRGLHSMKKDVKHSGCVCCSSNEKIAKQNSRKFKQQRVGNCGSCVNWEKHF